MKIHLIKVTSNQQTYLGFQERDDFPKKWETLYFMGHFYKVIDIREECVFVKFIE